MSFVVLDTDVSSASLRGRLADPLRARLAGQTWCISFVTVGELTKWTVLRELGARQASLASGLAAACASRSPTPSRSPSAGVKCKPRAERRGRGPPGE